MSLDQVWEILDKPMGQIPFITFLCTICVIMTVWAVIFSVIKINKNLAKESNYNVIDDNFMRELNYDAKIALIQGILQNRFNNFPVDKMRGEIFVEKFTENYFGSHFTVGPKTDFKAELIYVLNSKFSDTSQRYKKLEETLNKTLHNYDDYPQP